MQYSNYSTFIPCCERVGKGVAGDVGFFHAMGEMADQDKKIDIRVFKYLRKKQPDKKNGQ